MPKDAPLAGFLAFLLVGAGGAHCNHGSASPSGAPEPSAKVTPRAGPAASATPSSTAAPPASAARSPTTSTSASAAPASSGELASEYRGTLDGHVKVVARLVQKGQRVTGYYFYENVGGGLSLQGTLTGTHLKLDELASVGKTGVLEADLASDGALTGTWESAAKKKPLALSLAPIAPSPARTSALLFKRTLLDTRPVVGAKSKDDVCKRDLLYAEVFGLPPDVEAKLNARLAPTDDILGSHPCDHTMEARAGYEVLHNEDGILSLTLTGGVSDSQAAHPDSWDAPLTVWLATGDDVKLYGDILSPKDAPVVRTKLAALVAARTREAHASADDEKALLDSFGDPPSFVLDKQGVRLCASTPHYMANLGGCDYALAAAQLPHRQAAAAKLW